MKYTDEFVYHYKINKFNSMYEKIDYYFFSILKIHFYNDFYENVLNLEYKTKFSLNLRLGLVL